MDLQLFLLIDLQGRKEGCLKLLVVYSLLSCLNHFCLVNYEVELFLTKPILLSHTILQPTPICPVKQPSNEYVNLKSVYPKKHLNDFALLRTNS